MGVKAIDANTLEVTLKAPTPYFLEMLTHQSTYAISKANVEKFGADWVKPGNMVTNGAYTLTEFVPNDHIKLTKNPKFYDAANVKIDVVNYIPNEDRSAAMKRFEAGELDTYADLPTEQLADLKTKFGEQIRVGPYLGTYYYAIKTDKAPWDNVKLRNAVSEAIDRDFLAEKVWSNSMLPGYSMVPPGIEGYKSAMADLRRQVADRPRGRSQEGAGRAGLRPGQAAEDGDPLQHVGEPQEHGRRHPGAVEAARHRGVACSTPTPRRTTAIWSRRATTTSRAPAGSRTTSDPESFLGISVKASGNNYSNFNNEKFEALMKEAAAAGGDPAKRMDLLSQAERVLIDEVGNIPLLYYSFKNAVSTKIAGWEDNVMDRHPSRFISKN